MQRRERQSTRTTTLAVAVGIAGVLAGAVTAAPAQAQDRFTGIVQSTGESRALVCLSFDF